jgi:cyclopropane-fatty-acyl-phospholipid synthase
MTDSSGIAAFRKSDLASAPRVQALAKSAVTKLLQRIKRGCLVIEYNGQIDRFGNVDDPLQASIVVESLQAYQHVLRDGIAGAGEAYAAGLWRSPDLLAVIRVFSANLQVMARVDSERSMMSRLASRGREFLTRNSKVGSKKNITAHYDLNNDFFATFLDSQMMYSSAIFPAQDSTLDEASLNKLAHICSTLDIGADDHVVEIGCGWGGFASFAARETGCRVTAITISQEQYQYAVKRVTSEGLQDRVEIKMCDYRDLEGQYDKLVSIEMIEAVGHQYFDTYFSKCSELLKPDGKMLIQAITVADQRYEQAKNSIDFIKRYIFPGGCLPSITKIGQVLTRHTDLQLVRLEDITQHYARTLAAWRHRFYAATDEITGLGFDRDFMRLWEYYLCYCEGGFRERIISTVQLVACKPDCRSVPSI